MIPNIQLQAVAAAAARRAGEHVLANLHRRHDANMAAKSDVKHKLDVEAQEIATRTILDAYPDHTLLGEETCDIPLPDSEYRWVVDPIDGTINFFHGSPWWCCSVAVCHRNETVAAAVFAPEWGRLFQATADGPATCNGEMIHASDCDNTDLSIFLTGASGISKGDSPLPYFTTISKHCQRVRINGAAALDMCMVAAGKAEGYFEPGIYLWDLCAAELIVKRAGGCCTRIREHGHYKFSFLATNAPLHPFYRAHIDPLINPPK